MGRADAFATPSARNTTSAKHSENIAPSGAYSLLPAAIPHHKNPLSAAANVTAASATSRFPLHFLRSAEAATQATAAIIAEMHGKSSVVAANDEIMYSVAASGTQKPSESASASNAPVANGRESPIVTRHAHASAAPSSAYLTAFFSHR